jgi:predicted nuclease of predicted toxin-antitoxin system
MKILVDENVPLLTAASLRNLGHDVLDVRKTSYQGISDDLLWEIAKNDERLLITTDKGFVEYRLEKHSGILIVRLRQ